MSDDLISREETLYELATSAVYYFGIEEDKAAHDWAMGVVSKMPSAEPEIIRCKDCKHWTNNIGDSELRDNYCNEEAHGFYYRCNGDDYCSFAERRTDE